MKTTLLAVVAGLLLVGCAARYQFEYKLAGVEMPWRPVGGPTSERACYQLADFAMSRPVYLDGKPYTSVPRCTKVAP